ncbi:MAG: efflux RND transporter periplasmic adaptor subunit [Proteobacteria bacterium]|nr:efflux RND transporter periplasmic adaptor subunit [Pseudomonadota bacterium]MBU1389390.1 efflux RND transporter periplasmic adaptor subunit [Pseudomonadota bacterium]MBU1541210.1 efflux RND transporter periplasmic adaptor subunit [Pseudomonadota bacterium]MBU2429545.1 efflux RND transporter periplasmic adaptor subunit [Pseudomonadota bacterium]MBU2480183.1 efflux RND transporter periplasmic adaptor subunit [Pseudomonadota bacterium]
MKIKTGIACVLVILFSLAGYFSFVFKSSDINTLASELQEAALTPPAEVAVHTVIPEPLVLTRDLPGRTSAFKIAEIRPQVSGIILKRMYTEGSVVQKGQQLYQIDDAAYQAAYDKALASLEQVKASMKSIEPKARRYEQLLKAGSVTVQAYDDVMASLAQTKAGIAFAQASVVQAKIDLDHTRVFAPISGRTGRSNVTEGALVTNGQAMALATIQNVDQIYVDVNQSSQDVMTLKKMLDSQASVPLATLLLNGAEDVYAHKGRVLFSDITVDPGTGMVQIRIVFPNPENQLLPGLFVKARLAYSRQDNAITIPQQAVVRSPDGQVMVWLYDETSGTVNTHAITLSQAIGDRWLVTSGLKSRDRVVVSGLQKIRPMAKVTPVEFLPSNS